jgi:hypothetical protein
VPTPTWEKQNRALQNEELAAYREFGNSLKTAQARLRGRLDRVERKRDSLEAARDEPEVFVRMTSGPKKTVYHAPEGFCGYRPAWGKTMLRSEARIEGLRPCINCGWRIPA